MGVGGGTCRQRWHELQPLLMLANISMVHAAEHTNICFDSYNCHYFLSANPPLQTLRVNVNA